MLLIHRLTVKVQLHILNRFANLPYSFNQLFGRCVKALAKKQHFLFVVNINPNFGAKVFLVGHNWGER